MPMYVLLKHILPLFKGEQGFFEGARAEELLKQEAIRPLRQPDPEPVKEDYEDRQVTEPPKDRMLRKGRPRK